MPTTAEIHHPQIHIADMMERLGIEPGAGVIARLSLSYMTAFHRCHACPLKSQCGAWLDSHHAPLSSPPPFCPNGDILFELKFSDPGALR